MALIPKLKGAESAGEQFWWLVADMSERHGWDQAAIAAVMATETGYTFAPDAGMSYWSPARTATGLIQFIESTAKGLGVTPSNVAPTPQAESKGQGKAWATWTLAAMPAEQQLRYVEAYFARLSGYSRPVDYYLATWGARPGLSLDHVLAETGSKEYEANKGLDANKDGTITVQDLEQVIMRSYPAGWNPYPLGPRPPALVEPSSPLPPESGVPVPPDRQGEVGVLLALFVGLMGIGIHLYRKVRRG